MQCWIAACDQLCEYSITLDMDMIKGSCVQDKGHET